MRSLKRSFFMRWAIVPALLIAFTLSCTKWVVVKNPWPETVIAKQPSQVRARLATGGEIRLTDPRVENDKLIGTVPDYVGRSSSYLQSVSGKRALLAIPTSDVVAIQLTKTDGVRTALLVAALGVTVLAVASGLQEDPPPSRPSGGDMSSCPVVYSWDGEDWRLDSGTYGGAFLKPLSRTDVDVLERAEAADGWLRLRLANELAETDYVDELSVLVVDHAPGVTIAPASDGTLYAFDELIAPARARDSRGQDVLPRVGVADGWNWESALTVRDTANELELRDGIELAFPRPIGAQTARLLIDANNTPWSAHLIQEFVRAHGHTTDAWYDSLNADPVRAAKLGHKLASEAFLEVSVRGEDGWQRQGLVWEAGPEVVKRQALALDLSGVRGDSLVVRLESVPSFWLIDRVGVEYGPQPCFQGPPAEGATHCGSGR